MYGDLELRMNQYERTVPLILARLQKISGKGCYFEKEEQESEMCV
jgi:hypothetical protein